MDESLTPLLFFFFIVGVIVFAVVGWNEERKRRKALRAFARKHGFRYDAGKDRSVPRRYDYLAQLDKGRNRYAENIIKGDWEGYPVQFFDYHYETYSTDSKGNQQTQDHYLNVYICKLERSFPELRIYPENFLSKVGQALGYGDIDFESVEFSKTFTVRSPDKKFAYDICHGQMMEFLLQRRGTTVEIEHDTLAFIKDGRLKPEWVEDNLARLVRMRALFPEYLFDANEA